MTRTDIEKAKKLGEEIKNFNDTYRSLSPSEQLHGDRDGQVSADDLIAFMIEHPYFQEMARNINILSK